MARAQWPSAPATAPRDGVRLPYGVDLQSSDPRRGPGKRGGQNVGQFRLWTRLEGPARGDAPQLAVARHPPIDRSAHRVMQPGVLRNGTQARSTGPEHSADVRPGVWPREADEYARCARISWYS